MLKEETIPPEYLNGYIPGKVIESYIPAGKGNTLAIQIIHPVTEKVMKLDLSVDSKRNSKRYEQIKKNFGVEPRQMCGQEVNTKLEPAFAKKSNQHDWVHNLEIYPINPKQEPKPMRSERERQNLAAEEVSKILKFNWERLTAGNRARCYHIVRTVHAIMTGQFIPGEGIEIKDPGDANAESK